MKKTPVLAFFLCYSCFAMAQYRIQYLPKKDAVHDKSLSAFIDTLKAVTSRKDAAKLYALLDPKIVNSFDNRDGITNFKKTWTSKKNELWEVLNQLFTFGGQYTYETQRHGKNKDEYVYPYFFGEEIKGEQNYFDIFVVNGDSINLLQRGSTSSAIVTKLSYEVVKALPDSVLPFSGEWIGVQTLDGTYQGYIKNTLLYNFIDYRMFIRKKKIGWKITALVAGD